MRHSTHTQNKIRAKQKQSGKYWPDITNYISLAPLEGLQPSQDHQQTIRREGICKRSYNSSTAFSDNISSVNLLTRGSTDDRCNIPSTAQHRNYRWPAVCRVATQCWQGMRLRLGAFHRCVLPCSSSCAADVVIVIITRSSSSRVALQPDVNYPMPV